MASNEIPQLFGSSSITSHERSQRSVFVGNIPYEATEEQLKEIFATAGPVNSLRLVYDRETGKPKGYGFCEYQDQETAQSAMRNLNNHDFNGRPLRVGVASGETSKEEAMAHVFGSSDESIYGKPTEPEKAPEAISRAVASLPPEQMFELMKQMKMCIQNNPNEARNMLLQNPQLAYALLQAQIVMKIVDPNLALAMLHRQTEQIPPLLPSEKKIEEQPKPPAQGMVSPGQQMQHPAIPPQNTQIGNNRNDFLPGMSMDAGDRMNPGPGMNLGAPVPSNMDRGMTMDGRGPAGPDGFGMQIMNEQQGMHPEQEYRDRGRGGQDMGRNGPPMGRGGPDMSRGMHGMGRGMSDMGMERGGSDMSRGASDMGRGGLEMGRGGPDMSRGGPSMGRGGPQDFGRGGGSEMSRDGRSNMGRGPDIGMGRGGASDISRGGKPGVSSGQDMGRGGPDMGRGGPDMGRGGPDASRGGAGPRSTGDPRTDPHRDPRQASDPRFGAQRPPTQEAPSNSQSFQNPAQNLSSQDQEKAALIMQVLQLTDQQISLLPPEQRQSIQILKQQMIQSGAIQ